MHTRLHPASPAAVTMGRSVEETPPPPPRLMLPPGNGKVRAFIRFIRTTGSMHAACALSCAGLALLLPRSAARSASRKPKGRRKGQTKGGGGEDEPMAHRAAWGAWPMENIASYSRRVTMMPTRLAHLVRVVALWASRTDAATDTARWATFLSQTPVLADTRGPSRRRWRRCSPHLSARARTLIIYQVLRLAWRLTETVADAAPDFARAGPSVRGAAGCAGRASGLSTRRSQVPGGGQRQWYGGAAALVMALFRELEPRARDLDPLGSLRWTRGLRLYSHLMYF
ncbi:hypothetical protein GGX14DRAFT_559553 [Mycena pura]|uniref:Uncharacterized protein n=1 Tax=Mycena pura TaxID=153505 RepID=A0AAD6VRS7_9AGAR|nr:hypothetical protein GGX14DRAFT_559553 [Mycena pura]